MDAVALTQAGSLPVQQPAAVDTAPLTLGAYLTAVASAVRAGLPARSWIEATVVAAKPSSYGHSLQLVDPAGGSSPPQMRAFLRTAYRDAIAGRLGAPLEPHHLVGMTVVLQIEPEFHPRWGMGGRVVGLSAALRESMLRRALEEVRARLKREGLYDRQRRLRVPVDVTRVAVIHPVGAAGYADIATELARWRHAGIITVTSIPVPFEGPRAAAGLSAALGRAASSRPDLVLMVRGGGDQTGLMTLDDEQVARAVCLCPVPVITGLGHAVDRSLVDEIALACDTPSKALARLAALIAGPASRARADMEAIVIRAGQISGLAEQALDSARHRVLIGAERRLTGTAATQAETWSGVRTRVAGAAERCTRLEGEAARVLAAVLDRAPRRLDEAGRVAERLAFEALDRARRGVERADAGEAFMGIILTRARARLEAGGTELDRRIEGSLHDAGRRLTEAEIEVGRLIALADSLGLERTLARGFVLALARDGTLVPTRAAAIVAGGLDLHLIDGRVAARVEPTLTATLKGEAA